MITGDIKAKVDRIWDAFWAGGIANPMEVIEQITYLLFLRRLDDLHTLEENKAARLKKPIENPVFPPGKDSRGRPYQDLRWSHFKNFAPSDMYAVLSDHAFPFLRTLGGDGSTYAHHMKDARFTIPTPALLAKVVDLVSEVPDGGPGHQGRSLRVHARQDRQRWAERAVPHAAPHHPADGGDDRAAARRCHLRSGLRHGGFLIAAGEYLREHHPEMLRNEKPRAAFPPRGSSTASTSTTPCSASAA